MADPSIAGPATRHWWSLLAFSCLVGALGQGESIAATRRPQYYAHDAVEDHHGVIAPWYQGQNGVCDLRVRIAAETLRRYPWTEPARSETRVPEYLLSSFWSISPEGRIEPQPLDDWMNGDRGQLGAYVLRALTAYYRYSGDPVAKAHVAMQADLLLRYAQTGPDHPWPSFMIGVPCRGKPYGQCDPHGFIQLDIAARVGYGLLLAYQLVGDERWLETAKHWGDVLATHCDTTPGAAPWGRYANPEDVPWGTDNTLTGGVVWIAHFLDALIGMGYVGQDGAILEARDAARTYLRDRLLPAWTVHDTWGRQYWDWPQPTQAMNITPAVADYLMDRPDAFPNWQVDARNILSLALNRTSVNPESRADTYSGAWAYPESCAGMGRCLSAGPWLMAPTWARFGVLADSAWARELARRQVILCTYDVRPNGAAEDNIDGGVVTNGAWFESTHLLPLETTLGAIAWLPELFGPSRENHIVRSSAVVSEVVYGKGRVEYETFNAPPDTVDVLRLAFTPSAVTADGAPLRRVRELDRNGYTVTPLPDGDRILSIRHDGRTRVVVSGRDPQEAVDDDHLTLDGAWQVDRDRRAFGGALRRCGQAGAGASLRFTGNQVRLIGRADPEGGLADVHLDGEKQLAGIDCWSPIAQHQQVLFRMNGLADGAHEVTLVVRGEGNPRSRGTSVYIDGAQWSDAGGRAGFGEGDGPTTAQRLIFGYTGREDYVDSNGDAWKPGCEFLVRAGGGQDSVAAAWWTDPADPVAGTADPTLYQYGVHAPELVVNLTVGPGAYDLRLLFTATRGFDTAASRAAILVNGLEMVSDLDVAEEAGGPNRALDLRFRSIRPRNGVIEVRLLGTGKPGAEAFLQALELVPSHGSRGHG